MFLFSNDLGVDLGTSNVLIYADGKGLVVREPCVVAVDKNTGKILQVGAAARNMLGRTPGNVVAMKPLKDGIISDHEMTVRMLQEMFKTATKASLFTPKPRVVISVPSGVTEVEERSVINAAIEAGARRVFLIEEPLAAGLGAGLDIRGASGHLVVDIGGGTTGLAVFRDGKVVQTEDEPTGGTHLSLVLAGNYHISFEEAEKIKQDYSRHKEIMPVVRPVVEKMATIVTKYVKPEEADTIYLCGGTCCLTGIEAVFEKVTGIHTVKPADPFLVTPAGIAINCVLP